jgi:hypothetical protein
MNLQEAPADTLNYMILGYAVILGTMTLFVLRLALRFRGLARDQELLDDLERRGKH